MVYVNDVNFISLDVQLTGTDYPKLALQKIKEIPAFNSISLFYCILLS